MVGTALGEGVTGAVVGELVDGARVVGELVGDREGASVHALHVPGQALLTTTVLMPVETV